MASAANSDLRAYRPGQMVPISGIYTVIHLDHRAPHEAVAVRGDLFPACRICKGQVRFHIAQIVPHVTHDFDLAGPSLKVPKGRAKAANGGEG
jgi:hypothetical protein